VRIAATAAQGLVTFARERLDSDPGLAASVAVAFGAPLPPAHRKLWTSEAPFIPAPRVFDMMLRDVPGFGDLVQKMDFKLGQVVPCESAGITCADCRRPHSQSGMGWLYEVDGTGKAVAARCWPCSKSEKEDPVKKYMREADIHLGPKKYSAEDEEAIVSLVACYPKIRWRERLERGQSEGLLGERTAQGIMEHFNGALRKKLKKMGEEVPLQLRIGRYDPWTIKDQRALVAHVRWQWQHPNSRNEIKWEAAGA